MNKKLIAAAVSAAVVAPVAAHGEATFYGRINNAIDLKDIAADGDSTTDLSTVGSRFGFKYNQEVGNGMSVHGRYEFGTTTDKEKGNADGAGGVEDIRIATVGLSGSFGRIDVGNQWSSYYNTFGTLVSPTYSLGYYLYSSVAGGAFRASNTIKYSNNFGPLYAELDIRLNESDESADVAENLRGDGIGLGLSWAVTDNITIAAAFDSEDGADDQAAVTGLYNRVSTDYNPGNAKRREAETVELPDGTVKTFVAVTTAGASGGDIAVATVGTTAVAAAGSVIEEADVEPLAAGDDPDSDRVGIGIKYTFGDFWVNLGWQNYEVDANERTAAAEVDIDSTFLYGGGKIGEKTSWLLGYSVADDARDAVGQVVAVGSTTAADRVVGSLGSPATDDSTQITWGVYHNLGGGMSLYYEATDLDSENKNWDGAQHLIGMRVNF